MKTPFRRVWVALVAAPWLASPAPAAGDAPAHSAAEAETLEAADGTRTAGRLEGDPASGFRFVAAGTNAVTPLAPGMTVVAPGRGTPQAAGVPPFRLDLGLGQQVSGRLAGVDGREVRLIDLAGGGKLAVARGGVQAVVQRPGESLVFQDDFESLDTTRWSVVGEPDVSAGTKVAGAKSLRLPAGGASMTHRLDDAFGSGRLEVAFHDDGAVAEGQHWFVDLTFRGEAGRQTVRAVLGWAEESLAVESPGGPALAVQRLARAPGWHRLSVRFGPELSELAVDGNELAHGKGFGGALVEVRLASSSEAKRQDEPPQGLAGHLDDLRLVRFAEPVGGLETDATQDEVRLTSGDQLFGKVRSADGGAVALSVDGGDVSLPWGDVAGLYFRREAAPGKAVEGLLVRAEWRAAPGPGPRDRNALEGAVTGLTATRLTLETPYAGMVEVPRDRLTALKVVGQGRRLVIDPVAHHLGDEVSTTAPVLDPPQPEGGVLERSVDLPSVPDGPAFLVLDVVQVAGEAADLPFAQQVKKGELRTNLKLNGEPFDYLNRHITTKNESPERVRVPIPGGLLKAGKNVFRFELAGVEGDPNFLDDLGVLGVALEFGPAGGAAGPR